jgi:hypothetical protein
MAGTRRTTTVIPRRSHRSALLAKSSSKTRICQDGWPEISENRFSNYSDAPLSSIRPRDTEQAIPGSDRGFRLGAGGLR